MVIRRADQILKLAVLFEKIAASTAGYYVVFRKGSTADFYGPFADEGSAKKASYFGQSVEVSDQALKSHFYPFRTEYYDDNEIEYLKNDPSEISSGELTKVNFYPAHIPMHSSWKPFFSGGPFTTEEWWQRRFHGRE